MKINKEVTFYRPLKINDKELVYLDKYLNEFFEEIRYKAKCKSDTTIDFKDLSELIEYENPSFRKITNLEITANKKGSNRYFEDCVCIKFNSNSIFNYQSAHCSIGFNSIKDFDSFYDGFIKRMKCFHPWYSFFNAIPFSILTTIIFGIVSIVSTLTFGILSLFDKLKIADTKTSTELVFIQITFILICYFVIVYLIEVIMNFFFPRVFYDIGKQQKVLIVRHKILNIVFGIIVLGIIINIISALII